MSWLLYWWEVVRRHLAVQEPRRPRWASRERKELRTVARSATATSEGYADPEPALVIEPKSPSVVEMMLAKEQMAIAAAIRELGWWYHCGMDQRERAAAGRAGRN